MPNYDFKCKKKDCGGIETQFLTIDKRKSPLPCIICNGEMKRDFSSKIATPQLKIVPNIDWGTHRGSKKGEW